MANKRFLGRSLSYPLRIGPSGDFIKNIDSTQTVIDSIFFLLHTRIGERIHRPSTGTRLPDFKHEINSPLVRNLLAQEIIQSITFGEPRVKDLEVSVNTSPKNERALIIQIKFIIIPENVPTNLVFPFFLNS